MRKTQILYVFVCVCVLGGIVAEQLNLSYRIIVEGNKALFELKSTILILDIPFIIQNSQFLSVRNIILIFPTTQNSISIVYECSNESISSISSGFSRSPWNSWQPWKTNSEQFETSSCHLRSWTEENGEIVLNWVLWFLNTCRLWEQNTDFGDSILTFPFCIRDLLLTLVKHTLLQDQGKA